MIAGAAITAVARWLFTKRVRKTEGHSVESDLPDLFYTYTIQLVNVVLLRTNQKDLFSLGRSPAESVSNTSFVSSIFVSQQTLVNSECDVASRILEYFLALAGYGAADAYGNFGRRKLSLDLPMYGQWLCRRYELTTL